MHFGDAFEYEHMLLKHKERKLTRCSMFINHPGNPLLSQYLKYGGKTVSTKEVKFKHAKVTKFWYQNKNLYPQEQPQLFTFTHTTYLGTSNTRSKDLGGHGQGQVQTQQVLNPEAGETKPMTTMMMGEVITMDMVCHDNMLL